ncbi:MAG: META domain-containing protein [Planctomycetes bacterium]|nr:META domain-containing protein [Planctomycetota bacterium]
MPRPRPLPPLRTLSPLAVSLLALSLLVPCGCGAAPAIDPTTVEGRLTEPAQLVGTSWRLTMIDGAPATPGVTSRLAFDREGVRGNGGVNSFGAAWALDANGLRFGPPLCTKMAGPPAAMAQESRFLNVLGEVDGARREAGRLRLTRGSATVLELEPDA